MDTICSRQYMYDAVRPQHRRASALHMLAQSCKRTLPHHGRPCRACCHPSCFCRQSCCSRELAQHARPLTRLIPEIMLATTDWADRPTMIPDTPVTVSRGWMLMPSTCSIMRPPARTTSQELRPLRGSTTRSRARSCTAAACTQSAWPPNLAAVCMQELRRFRGSSMRSKARYCTAAACDQRVLQHQALHLQPSPPCAVLGLGSAAQGHILHCSDLSAVGRMLP